MDITEINNLEYQVDGLLRAIERLKAENQSLRHKLTHITHEKTRLQEGNQKAAGKIRRIMNQLQEELA